jgi:hypothetical protein
VAGENKINVNKNEKRIVLRGIDEKKMTRSTNQQNPFITIL